MLFCGIILLDLQPSYLSYPDVNKPKSTPKEPSLLPPDTKKQASRPTTKRKKALSVGLKKLIKCSQCNELGYHNKTTC